MKPLRPIPFILILCVLAAGCRKGQEMDPELDRSEDVCLRVKGKAIFTYDIDQDQLTFNEFLQEFRAGSDDMGSYFIVTCKQLPTRDGQDIKADLRWKNGSGSAQKRSGLTFRVQKTDEQGRIWLWCSKERIGAVVRKF